MRPGPDKSSPTIGQALTLAALLGALALVLLRATANEALRDDAPALPGISSAPRIIGAAGGIALDLLCCVPALLVMLRRLLEKDYALRLPWSFLPLGALCAAMAASPLWASDKFAAAAAAAHWIAACALMWTACQVARSWLHLRFVAAVCAALLAVLVAKGVYYRLVEWPALKEDVRQDQRNIMEERGYAPDSFMARQLMKKVEVGEMMGFAKSPNTLGALLVMLAIVTAGIIVQRLVEKKAGDRAADALPAVLLGGLVILVGIWVIRYTGSKAAAVAAGMAVLIFLAAARWRRWLGQHATRAWWLGVLGAALAITAVVGHGLAHGRLPTESLLFRWRYWVAAARLFAHHALLGVGWDNFGNFYLQYRLPEAAESIKDPHCFLVKFFVELGAIGGAMALAWLLRLAWELTRPVMPPCQTPPARRPRESAAGNSSTPTALPGVLRWTLSLGALYLVLCAIFILDWPSGAVYGLMLMAERLMFTAILILVAAVLSLRSLERPAEDDRPAPWVLGAMLTAAGIFLVQNLVDFSWFEPGPMYVLALISGTALGMRRSPNSTSPGGRTGAAIGLALSLTVWLGAVGFLWLPTLAAERNADAADDAIRSIPADDTSHATPKAVVLRRRQLDQAAGLMAAACARQPLNADYLFRAARIAAMRGEPIETLRQLLERAIAGDPHNLGYQRALAHYESLLSHDASRIRNAFAGALELSPNDIRLRLEYATALRQLGGQDALRNAAAQDAHALRLNRLLPPHEPNRLAEAEVAAIEKRIPATAPVGR